MPSRFACMRGGFPQTITSRMLKSLPGSDKSMGIDITYCDGNDARRVRKPAGRATRGGPTADLTAVGSSTCAVFKGICQKIQYFAFDSTAPAQATFGCMEWSRKSCKRSLQLRFRQLGDCCTSPCRSFCLMTLQTQQYQFLKLFKLSCLTITSAPYYSTPRLM